MSCSACFLEVHPAIMKPTKKMIADTNFEKCLPVARPKVMRYPERLVMRRPLSAILPTVACEPELSIKALYNQAAMR